MTSKYLFDLSLSLSIYLALFVSLCGWGQLLSFVLKFKFPTGKNYFSNVWLGLAFCVFLVQLLHFWIPIAAPLSLAIFLGGASLFLIFSIKKIYVPQEEYNKAFGIEHGVGHSIKAKWLYLYVILLAFYAVWIASHAMLLPTAPDSIGYHFQAIQWQNEYPLVRGLGNFNDRVAYNQSFFSYAALLNIYPYYNHARSIASSFFLLLLASEFLYISLAYFLSKKKYNICSLAQLFSILSLPIILLFSALSIDFWGMNIASPSPDIFVALLQFALFLRFLRLLETKDREMRFTQLKIVLILSALSITIKLSTAMFSFLLALVSLCFVFYKEKSPFMKFTKKLNLSILFFYCDTSSLGSTRDHASGGAFFPCQYILD